MRTTDPAIADGLMRLPNVATSAAVPKLYTTDVETDPFAYGEKVYPFCCCIFSDDVSKRFWGDNCVPQMMEWIREHVPPGSIIYAHNGGRFDFFYFLDYFDKQSDSLVIVHNRIVQAKLEGGQVLRDSFKLFPFSLATYKKTEIDYSKFTRDRRELFRDEILDYLEDDCRDLYELVTAYWEEFGDSLTIGTTAFKRLKEMYDVGPELGYAWDKHLRDNYYFGGRVERYKIGVFEDGPYKIFDLNSAYPFAMRDYRHPSGVPRFGDRISEDTFFLRVSGHNYGAFPRRTEKGLTFAEGTGVFCVSIHEFNTAVELGKFKPFRVLQTVDFARSINFEEFVTLYYGKRISADAIGDKLRKLLYKYFLNNSYGKFSINPENYKDFCITSDQEEMPLCLCKTRKCKCDGWRATMHLTHHKMIMWERPTKQVRRMNIATGASITGATRSLLMRGLANADCPMYCDTDSIVAKGLSGVPFSSTNLGAWKLECTGDVLAIGGRKMYALFETDRGCEYEMGFSRCLKSASKGVNLGPDQIIQVARGETVLYNQAAPVFRLDGSIDFIQRNVRVV